MLTVGVFLYPAANRRIYTVALCYGIIYVIRIRLWIFIYHSVGFLPCTLKDDISYLLPT